MIRHEPEIIFELLLPTKAVEGDPNEEKTEKVFRKTTLQPGRYQVVEDLKMSTDIVLKPVNSKSSICYWVSKMDLVNNSLKFKKGG